MTVVQFHDMHSGGSIKIKPYSMIYIDFGKILEGKTEKQIEKIAIKHFSKRFGRYPLNTTCKCCGEDYSITVYKNIFEATAFERKCEWNGKRHINVPMKYSFLPTNHPDQPKYVPLWLYLKREDVMVVRFKKK